MRGDKIFKKYATIKKEQLSKWYVIRHKWCDAIITFIYLVVTFGWQDQTSHSDIATDMIDTQREWIIFPNCIDCMAVAHFSNVISPAIQIFWKFNFGMTHFLIIRLQNILGGVKLLNGIKFHYEWSLHWKYIERNKLYSWRRIYISHVLHFKS